MTGFVLTQCDAAYMAQLAGEIEAVAEAMCAANAVNFDSSESKREAATALNAAPLLCAVLYAIEPGQPADREDETLLYGPVAIEWRAGRRVDVRVSSAFRKWYSCGKTVYSYDPDYFKSVVTPAQAARFLVGVAVMAGGAE